ncbi:MAG: amidohydrolase [Streptosporangiaceae bacterium]
MSNGSRAEIVARRTREILPDAAQLAALVALYKDLHSHPELSGQETRTSKIIADRLRSARAEVTTGIGGTGVAGLIRNGDGPLVMIRADMDALPVEERTGVAYASQVIGVTQDGEQTPVMHACGHDVNIAALAGAVDALARSRDQWSGTLMAVAQPAEETGEGAEAMLRDALFDRLGKPDVALAQHVDGFRVGQVAHAPGLITSGALNVNVRITGRGGHGSLPETTIDPVVVAAFIILRLQTIVSRELGPMEPAVVTVGKVRAGLKANVIPDDAELALNLRFRSASTKDKLLGAITRIVRAECAAAGCTAEPAIVTYGHFPPLNNDEQAEQAVRGVHEELLGIGNVHDLPLVMGSEDFSAFGMPEGHYQGAPVPYCYWTFGGHSSQVWDPALGDTYRDKMSKLPAPHASSFAPEPATALSTGIAALTCAALAFLRPEADRGNSLQ